MSAGSSWPPNSHSARSGARRSIAAPWRSIHRLTDLPELTDEEFDYRDSLALLVADYEDEHEPMDDLPPSVVLRELIAAKGVTQRAVAAAAGVSDATVSAILAGQRKPSRKVMAALAGYFGVHPAVFL